MTKVSTALQVVLGVGIISSGIMKLAGGVDDMRTDLEIASWLWTLIALVEIAGGLLLVASLKFTRLALPVAAFFSAFMVGAIISHLRVGDTGAVLVNPAVLLVMYLFIVVVRSNLFSLPPSTPAEERS